MQETIRDNTFWNNEINEFKRSGLSARNFSIRKGYPYTTFMGRLHKHSPKIKKNESRLSIKTLNERPSPQTNFSKVVISEKNKPPYPIKNSLRILFPNGITLEFEEAPSPGWIAELGGIL